MYLHHKGITKLENLEVCDKSDNLKNRYSAPKRLDCVMCRISGG